MISIASALIHDFYATVSVRGIAVFSLSGLLLSLPFWTALPHQRPPPSYAAFLLVIITGWWRVPWAASDIVLHYTFLFNLAEFSIFSINAPFWSLAVEMQFYLLLPLLFALLARITTRATVAHE